MSFVAGVHFARSIADDWRGEESRQVQRLGTHSLLVCFFTANINMEYTAWVVLTWSGSVSLPLLTFFPLYCAIFGSRLPFERNWGLLWMMLILVQRQIRGDVFVGAVQSGGDLDYSPREFWTEIPPSRYATTSVESSIGVTWTGPSWTGRHRSPSSACTPADLTISGTFPASKTAWSLFCLVHQAWLQSSHFNLAPYRYYFIPISDFAPMSGRPLKVNRVSYNQAFDAAFRFFLNRKTLRKITINDLWFLFNSIERNVNGNDVLGIYWASTSFWSSANCFTALKLRLSQSWETFQRSMNNHRSRSG